MPCIMIPALYNIPMLLIPHLWWFRARCKILKRHSLSLKECVMQRLFHYHRLLAFIIAVSSFGLLMKVWEVKGRELAHTMFGLGGMWLALHLLRKKQFSMSCATDFLLRGILPMH